MIPNTASNGIPTKLYLGVLGRDGGRDLQEIWTEAGNIVQWQGELHPLSPPHSPQKLSHTPA
jgi:hypothetical protein